MVTSIPAVLRAHSFEVLVILFSASVARFGVLEIRLVLLSINLLRALTSFGVEVFFFFIMVLLLVPLLPVLAFVVFFFFFSLSPSPTTDPDVQYLDIPVAADLYGQMKNKNNYLSSLRTEVYNERDLPVY